MNSKYYFYVLVIMISSLISFGCISCGNDEEDDDDPNPITEYVGAWRCISPATYIGSTIVKEGNTLLISKEGEMIWTNLGHNAIMHALGDGWADITYKKKILQSRDVCKEQLSDY